jgi:uncharacterized membrane protein YfcA
LTLALGVVCVAFGCLVGGATGFGYALVSTPLLLLAGYSVPEVVFVNLVVGLVTRAAVTWSLRDHMVWPRVGLLALGSIPGAWIGAEVLHMLPLHHLKLGAGVVVALCGIAMLMPDRGGHHAPSRGATAATGAVGGFLSTTTSLNGPPPALLLARAGVPPLVFIADLAGYLTVVSAVSLIILGASGQIPHAVLWPALPILLAAGLGGNMAGLWVARRLPVHVFRFAVIALVIVAGALTALSA